MKGTGEPQANTLCLFRVPQETVQSPSQMLTNNNNNKVREPSETFWKVPVEMKMGEVNRLQPRDSDSFLRVLPDYFPKSLRECSPTWYWGSRDGD